MRVQQSTCQVQGIVLGAWGWGANVGDTALALSKHVCGEKTTLQKAMI